MIKKVIIVLFSLLLVGIIIYNIFPTKIAILTYHDFVYDNIENNMQIKLSSFEKEIKYLSDHHYESLTPEDIKCFINKDCKINKKSVLITFDDGWKNELEAIKILEKYNMKATIFYIGNNLENPNFMSQEDLIDIKNNHPNITLASHSYNLHYEDAYQKDYDSLKNDFEVMNNILDTKYFAYPYGLSSDNYKKVLNDYNYDLAFTFGPDKEHRKVSTKDNKYAIPRLNFSTDMPFWKFKLRLLLPF